MTTTRDTENRLVLFQYHDGQTKLGVVFGLRAGSDTSHFPFRLTSVLGREWVMSSRGSGGPKSIPIYDEILN